MTHLTEEDRTYTALYTEAKEQTAETFPAFFQKLLSDYSYDYGTICHALAAAAVSAATAMNRSPVGGITGFQSSFVMWQFIREWGGHEAPLRLLDYDKLLYPQYASVFQPTISQETFAWAQEEARKNIAEPNRHGPVAPNVMAHWQSLVEGKVPFNLTIAD